MFRIYETCLKADLVEKWGKYVNKPITGSEVRIVSEHEKMLSINRIRKMQIERYYSLSKW